MGAGLEPQSAPAILDVAPHPQMERSKSERRKLRVGLVGCGLVAQVMHLPYLCELNDYFEIAVLCDLSADVANLCAERYKVQRTAGSWEDLLEDQLDALLVLTSGSHAPIAVAAAEAGMHVFVEKPMSFSTEEGLEMIKAADRADVRLMVGYMKRYDPAYERLTQELATLDDLRLVRVTTLEAPFEPYVSHYPFVPAPRIAPDALAALEAETERRLRVAVGDVDPVTLRAYHAILLDSLIHELNLLRGALGEPDSIDFAEIRESGVTLVLTFGGAQCSISWIDLPGIARYEQEFAFFSPSRRATLSFPSPFLRNAPTLLAVEGGDAGTPRSWKTLETVSYEEAFKNELMEFHRSVVEGDDPRTSGRDALRDVALCQSIVRAYCDRRALVRPTGEGEVAYQ